MSGFDRLAPADRRKADDFVAALQTLRDGDPPVMGQLAERLRMLLGADVGSTYSLRRDDEGVRLDHFSGSGMDARRYIHDFDAALRTTRAAGVLWYDPLRPTPRQRNRVVLRPHARFQGSQRAWFSAQGLGAFDQLRMLVCEGDTLLAWVGVLSQGGLSARQRKLFASVAPALQQRLVLERHLRLAPALLPLVGSALEAIGAPALLLDGAQVVHANAAARMALQTNGRAVRDTLRDHLAGVGDGTWAISRTQSRGAPTYALAIASAPAPGAAARAGVLAARWCLTRRQTEVLACLARGRSNKAIAAELSCAEATVELHVTALLSKAECASRAELVARFWTVL
jgi:DNA-binding CsgD family transcriptional regulator